MSAALSTPRRFRLGVIGAGRVGAVLAAALHAAGYEAVAVSGGSAASRTRIEMLLPHLSPVEPEQVARVADLLLLSVPDDSLGALVERLSAADALRPGQVVVHTSGRHGLAVASVAADRGCVTVALHPAMTFTGTDVDLDRLPGCTYGLTADPDGREVARQLVADLGGRTVEVAEEQRTLYHAALAHGANHLGTLVAQAMDLLRAAGSTNPAGTLRPLLQAALDNCLTYGDAALTGPVVRGDSGTVADHLSALQAFTARASDGAVGDSDDISRAYVAMASVTATRAERAGRLDTAAAAELQQLLEVRSHHLSR